MSATTPAQEMYVVQQLRKQYAQQYKDEYASEVIRVYEQERFDAADLIERLRDARAAVIEDVDRAIDAWWADEGNRDMNSKWRLVHAVRAALANRSALPSSG